jgi:hypothetical protein
VRSPTLGVPIEEILGAREARGTTVAGTQVHSVRLPSFVVSTEIVFAADGERLSIRHDAGETPAPYVSGTLLAIRAVPNHVGLIRGLDQLLGSGLVDPQRVAAIGYCFGGAVCQALAYSGAPLAGIVSFHGSLIPATPETAAANHAKFLICHGAMDPFTSADALAAFKKSLDAGKIDYQLIVYSGAVHAFTNPEADKIAAATGLPIAYNEAADRRSWSHMAAFLEEIFAAKK